MKRLSLKMAGALAILTLLLSAHGSAQQTGRAKDVQTSPALERSLNQLEQGLKKGATLNFRQGYPERRYTRLKRMGGCQISFRISTFPGIHSFREPNRPAPNFSTDQVIVNLAELDRAGIRVENPGKGEDRIIHFTALGGQPAIKWESSRLGESGWGTEGYIYVGEEETAAIAAALEQAIIACQE